jgi:hypothetical protein
MMMAQRLSGSYEEKLVSFQKYAWKLRQQDGYLLEQTGNADENLVFLAMLDSMTINCASK